MHDPSKVSALIRVATASISNLQHNAWGAVKNTHDIISNNATKALAKKVGDLGEHVTQDEIRSKLMRYSCFRGIKFISGHLPHLNGYIEEVPDSYDLVTVLRNPVDRFVSKYYFRLIEPVMDILM